MSLLSFFGCKNGSDTESVPRFVVESATHDLDPISSAETPYPGIPGVMNADDDNGDGVTDWKQATFDPEDDDYTTLTVVSDSVPVQLRLDGGNVRIWHDGAIVLEDSGSWSPPPAQQVSLYVEFGGTLASAKLTVKDKETDETVNTYLTASPMILGHHSQTTEKVWVMELNFSDYSNMDMIRDMSEVLGDRLVTVNAAKYDYDVWVQDEFELSSMVSGESRMDVIIDSIRDGQGQGGLDDVPEDIIAGRNTIVKTYGSGQASTYDSFGNLEVSPPLMADGIDYPYGRIYYGKKGSNGPVDSLTSKLADQKIQSPFEVDTTWLCVGHVDEFTAFVPDDTAPRGFRFVFADTRSGWAILDGADASMSLPRYASNNAYQGHGIADVGAMTNQAGLRSYNEDVQEQHLDPILAQFKEELALTDDEIILFPSVFHEEMYGNGICGGVALVPGAVNMLLVTESDGSSHAFMADPFFRSSVSSQAGDAFIEAYDAVLPPSLQVHYVDDFEVYHLGLGEVHCGTNSLRTPTDGWWETSAHLLKEEE